MANGSNSGKGMTQAQMQAMINQAVQAGRIGSAGDIKGDIQAGREFGREVIQPGSLGRESAQVMGAHERLAKGLTAPEMQAQRDVALQGIGQQTAQSRRALAAIQARQGVRGATAAAQQMGIEQSAQKQRQEFERNLLLGQRQAEIQGLGLLQESQRFDLGQAAREKFGEIQAGLGFAQLGVAERAGIRGAQSASQAAAAQACFAGETLIKMADDTFKRIDQIELGDNLTTGKVLGLTKHLVNMKDLVIINDAVMTYSHIVFHADEWKEARHVDGAIRSVNDGNVAVYDLITTTHKIELAGGLICADYEGKEITDQYNKDLVEELNESIRGVC